MSTIVITQRRSLLCLALIAAAVGCAAPTDDNQGDDGESESEALTSGGAVHVGNATNFSGQGDRAHGAIGACGVPEGMLDSQNYVALNVQDTPRDYGGGLQRPIPSGQASKIGEYDNGRNCGRFMRVAIEDRCNGVNDGANGQPFCRGGKGFVDDPHKGAALNMIVSDSCQDGNAWCRDDPNHIDLHTSALQRFYQGGREVDVGKGWTNDRVKWQYRRAPRYQGDVRLAFAQNSFAYYPAIIVAHLENGIHGVLQQGDDGKFTPIPHNGDQGQVFVLRPGKTFRIKIIDAEGKELHGGRVYSFHLPSSCEGRCKPFFTDIAYTTGS
jgi:hypothetical protein